MRRIHHVQITCAPDDVPAMRAFYCDVLGLTEITKPESLRGRGGFWLRIGEQEVHVGVETKTGATKAHIAYQVDDLTEWRARLEAAGVAITESIPIPGYDRFECIDAGGNRVEFIQPTAR